MLSKGQPSTLSLLLLFSIRMRSRQERVTDQVRAWFPHRIHSRWNWYNDGRETNSCFGCSSVENIRTLIWRFSHARLTTDAETGTDVRLDDPFDWDEAFDRECTRDIDRQWYSQTDPIRWRSLLRWWWETTTMMIEPSTVKQTSHSTLCRCIRACSADDPIDIVVDDC